MKYIKTLVFLVFFLTYIQRVVPDHHIDPATNHILEESDHPRYSNHRRFASDDPTQQFTVFINGPATPANMLVGIELRNVPMDVNAYVAFQVTGPDPSLNIMFPKTIILVPDQILAVPANWPANYQASMTITYWQDGLPPIGLTFVPFMEIYQKKIN